MTVHFYDVGQALAALVDLPDGRHLLVDAADRSNRAGCGDVCPRAAKHLSDALRADLAGAPIDLLWLTHQHSDHIGGAPDVLTGFHVTALADNGLDTARAEVAAVHRAAEQHGTTRLVIDPGHHDAPLASAPGVTLSAIVPSAWPASCPNDANACSIALRIDFCASSVLFTGDSPRDEEPGIDPRGPVTLLQVGHHGSDTSSTPAFLAKARPRYAVISAGKPGEGLNTTYCHPRAIVAKRLTALLGGPGAHTMKAFDGTRCAGAPASEWIDVAASDRLWLTARDGDVVLTTTGDGTFTRKP